MRNSTFLAKMSEKIFQNNFKFLDFLALFLAWACFIGEDSTGLVGTHAPTDFEKKFKNNFKSIHNYFDFMIMLRLCIKLLNFLDNFKEFQI